MYLVAVNYDRPDQSVSLELRDGETARVGRHPERGDENEDLLFFIPWQDKLVSRNHFRASCASGRLSVERLPALAGRGNPNVLYSNDAPRERETLAEPVLLEPGDAFVIGAKGITAFYWLEKESDLAERIEEYRSRCDAKAGFLTAAPSKMQRYDDVEMLDEYSLRLQLKLIQRDLPEQVLAGWANRRELFTRAASFIENALPGQKGVTAAFVAVNRLGDEIAYERLHPDATDRADFQPSRTLLGQLQLDDPVPWDVHLWTSQKDQEAFRSDSLDRRIDWVAVVPVAPFDDTGQVHRDRDQGRPVYLYVETRQATDTSAATFLPFLRLIASLIASLLSARDQQRIQDRMSTFFSPGLRMLMAEANQSLLEPAMADCTIMFADRRGSSHVIEKAKTDEEILNRLRENQEIVGKITEFVFEHDGVITDFAGDGALALWGWPNVEAIKKNHAILAVSAAEDIVRNLAERGEFEEDQGRFMAPVRLGVSTGRLAVGKTGPVQQWHISVFGGVANLGARLERMAKEFKIPVLTSSETYQRTRRAERFRFRRLCLIRPAGFRESYPIYELILPREWGGSGADLDLVRNYETALDHLIQREWDAAIDILSTLPRTDEPTLWLEKKALALRGNPPGPEWSGEIQSLTK